ncbi:hypothetical protein LX36DRAFT_657094 [Colletotrichum falcatum]|nr:hypothetical protein LX36DRAFT_657094 [Colletotrichum falcatum]
MLACTFLPGKYRACVGLALHNRDVAITDAIALPQPPGQCTESPRPEADTRGALFRSGRRQTNDAQQAQPLDHCEPCLGHGLPMDRDSFPVRREALIRAASKLISQPCRGLAPVPRKLTKTARKGLARGWSTSKEPRKRRGHWLSVAGHVLLTMSQLHWLAQAEMCR